MSEKRVFLPVAAAYDRWSAFYDTYENPMVFAAGTVVAMRAANWADKDVFEFGCGTGRNLSVMKSAGARSVAGSDFSEGMLSVARARDASFALLRRDMSLPLPLAEASVDVVLFCLTLEHVADLVVPLKEAGRIVRPGGEIAVLEIHPYMSHSGVSAHFKDGAEEVSMPAYPHQFSSYINAVSEAGLRLQGCREWCPKDFGEMAPLKALKRGPDFPLVVEFSLSR